MQLKGFLLAVSDLRRSLQYYRELFGLELLQDNDGNLMLSQGLVLQDKRIWQSFLQREITTGGCGAELYFEEADLDAFLEKLARCYPDTVYVNRPMTHSWGQRVVRFLDPDGHLIEVGTPM